MSKQLFSILNFILFGNIYMAIAAVCMVQSTVVQLQIQSGLIPYSVLLFFSTLFIYNLQRIFYSSNKNNTLNSVRRDWIFTHTKLIKLLAIVGCTGTLISFYFCDFRLLIYLFPLLFLSVAYFLPVLKLRRHPLVKPITLAGVWTIATALIPMLLSGKDVFNVTVFFYVLSRFCFIIAICIPFDIRDLKIDAYENIVTLPQLTGEKKAINFAVMSLILHVFFVLLVFLYSAMELKNFVASLFVAILTISVVLITNTIRTEYFYLIAVDGTLIVQGIVLIAANHIF